MEIRGERNDTSLPDGPMHAEQAPRVPRIKNPRHAASGRRITIFYVFRPRSSAARGAQSRRIVHLGRHA